MDSAELESLFRQHGADVFRRARYLLGNDEDAKEATQEVFLRVMRTTRAFAGESSVGTWLYRITTNHCLNTLRDKRRRRELWQEFVVGEPEAVTSPVDPAGAIRQFRAVATAGSRDAALAGLDVATLVLHGSADTLIAPDGGRHVAEVIPGAHYREIDGLGHDLPPGLWGTCLLYTSDAADE